MKITIESYLTRWKKRGGITKPNKFVRHRFKRGKKNFPIKLMILIIVLYITRVVHARRFVHLSLTDYSDLISRAETSSSVRRYRSTTTLRHFLDECQKNENFIDFVCNILSRDSDRESPPDGNVSEAVMEGFVFIPSILLKKSTVR